MSVPPETDLLLPRPASGERWDPHTIHTYYFGFAVPERALGAFVYLRCLPALGVSQGGVCLYQGLDNLALTDTTFTDYMASMPWPEVDGNRITTYNGLGITIEVPGRRFAITYRDAATDTAIDLVADAITPLAARHHLVPGEELARVPESGGSEQFMHYTGTVRLRGEDIAVDCLFPRDRSWRQVRTEHRDAHAAHPPLAWTPIAFSADFAFNQIGIESPDTDPAWTGLHDVPADAPTHHFAWAWRGGAIRQITRVRRAVTEFDPRLLTPLAMTIEADDDAGDSYRFTGRAIAATPLPMWPNVTTFDSVYRWEDEQGRTAFGTVQGMHTDSFARHVRS